MTGLPDPKPIREFSGVDRRVFEEEIRPLGQPAILRGLGADWPAVQAAKRGPEAAVDYLLSFHPAKVIGAILGPPEIKGRFFYNSDFTGMNFSRGEVTLDFFLQRLLGEREVDPPFAMAVQSEKVPELLPGFVEANAMPLLDGAIVPRIWIGNRIRVAPHFDLMENIGVVMAGRRRFTVFPPEQLPNMYIGPLEITPAGTPVSVVDLENPDLDRFPRFAEAAEHAQSAVLEEGDGIYLPFHWWHAVDSLAQANAFVNYWWNDAREGLGSPYDALMYALFALRGRPLDQRKVWRMVFDRLVFAIDEEPVEHLPPHARGVLGPTTPGLLGRMRATLKQIMAGL